MGPLLDPVTSAGFPHVMQLELNVMLLTVIMGYMLSNGLSTQVLT